MRRKLWQILIWSLGGLLGGSLAGQEERVPLSELGEAIRQETAERTWQWRVMAGEGALREGFAALAATYFRNALGDPALPAEAVERTQLDFLTALLASNQRDEAAAVLAARGDFGAMGGERWQLRAAWLAYGRGEAEQARELLRSIPEGVLPEAERPWFLVLDALLWRKVGDFETSNQLFAEAIRLAPTDGLRTHFELLRRRSELQTGEATEAVLGELRMATRNLRGQVGEAEASRLLAVALARLERNEEALEVIERQLQRPGVMNSPWRDDFYLLMGLIAGDESGRGRLALRQVLSGEASVQLQRQALMLLARAPFEGSFRTDFLRFLGELINRPTPSPVLDRLLLLRAQLYTADRRYDSAEADVERLIDQFPSSSGLVPAHHLGAFLNWSRPVPRYRTAASYLNTVRGLVEDPTARARLTALMGDCYFLNADYLNASEAYGSALRDPGLEGVGAIWYQRALAEIRAGRLGQAESILDEGARDARFAPLVRWQAEWNLLDALRSEGDSARAFQRLRRLLGGEAGAVLPPEVALRVRWLEARLTLEVGREEETPALVDGLLAAVEGSSLEELPASDRPALLSHALLLKGEALLALGQRAEALAVFGDLRTRFPDSGPDMLSYLIEARLAGSENSVVEAQASLITLADRFPESRYAPVALWEAALQAEQRGLDATFREAIRNLERLLEDYPESPLGYYARLKQADLSRRLNDFGTALVLYERLLAQYPDHPERFRAELSRADCLFARGSQSADSLVAASVVYERLFLDNTTPLDAQVEAGFKWASTLVQRNLRGGAKEALFGLKDQILDDPERSFRLGPQGRYWMARALLELGRLEEAENTLESFAAARVIYRRLITAGLPGEALARERLGALDAG